MVKFIHKTNKYKGVVIGIDAGIMTIQLPHGHKAQVPSHANIVVGNVVYLMRNSLGEIEEIMEKHESEIAALHSDLHSFINDNNTKNTEELLNGDYEPDGDNGYDFASDELDPEFWFED